MSKLSTIICSIVMISSIATLSGCSQPESSPTGETYQNSENVTGLIYRADGSTGDGADDVSITIEPIESQQTQQVKTDSLVPWTSTVAGSDGDKVRMTVESLSSNGEAECQISYRDIIIHNTASGDHAIAVCEGTLSAWADQ